MVIRTLLPRNDADLEPLKAWNYDKNIKDHEMRAILRARHRRKVRQNKRSIFYVRDQLVDPKKIERFARRKACTCTHDHPIGRLS